MYSNTTLPDHERRGFPNQFPMTHERSVFGGSTMEDMTSDWREDPECFLEPFLSQLSHKARRHMCPLYVSGLIGPSDHESIHELSATGITDASTARNSSVLMLRLFQELDGQSGAVGTSGCPGRILHGMREAKDFMRCIARWWSGAQQRRNDARRKKICTEVSIDERQELQG